MEWNFEASVACLVGPPTQGEAFGPGLWEPGFYLGLLCGLEKSLNFPDLGFVGCEAGLARPGLSLWEVRDVTSCGETAEMCLSKTESRVLMMAGV